MTTKRSQYKEFVKDCPSTDELTDGEKELILSEKAQKIFEHVKECEEAQEAINFNKRRKSIELEQAPCLFNQLTPSPWDSQRPTWSLDTMSFGQNQFLKQPFLQMAPNQHKIQHLAPTQPAAPKTVPPSSKNKKQQADSRITCQLCSVRGHSALNCNKR